MSVSCGGVADDHERHGAGGLLLDLGDLADRRRQAVGEEAQQLGRVLVDRAGEGVDLRDPVAADRVAAVAQRAVDELDVVFATAEHDERYRGLGHAVVDSDGESRQCKQPQRGLSATRVTLAARVASLRDHGFT